MTVNAALNRSLHSDEPVQAWCVAKIVLFSCFCAAAAHKPPQASHLLRTAEHLHGQEAVPSCRKVDGSLRERVDNNVAALRFPRVDVME